MSERIVIVGAGIIGLGIGWQMAKAGREVVVVEARKPGRGATWAAAGLLAARLQAGDPRDPPVTVGCCAAPPTRPIRGPS